MNAATARLDESADPDRAAQPALLTIRGLSKTFTLHNLGGRQIRGIDDVDLEVRSGEHVALAGPSGAGKSTLLKCVYRSYLPTAGSVELRSETLGSIDLVTLDDSELADLRHEEIGYVSQFLRAEPRRSALEVVARAGIRRGLPRVRAFELAAVSLRRVGIPEDLWGSYPSVLSGGERQRVNLAAGTIEPPRLLLLDEPVSALDPANRENVLQLIADLVADGVALLSVFHDLEAMRRLATRVVVMRDGRIVAQGAPHEVLRSDEETSP